MSGLVDVDTVKRIRRLAAAREALDARLVALQKEDDAISRKIRDLDIEIRKNAADRSKLMRHMDIESPGNAGYESRMQAFIDELIRQSNNPLGDIFGVGLVPPDNVQMSAVEVKS